jgi:solute carrier family 25 carnitine/acylcarnitine transporter 20/29
LLVQIGTAGSLAGSVMAFLNCPIELLKVKLQTQDPKGVIGFNGKLEPPVRLILLSSYQLTLTQIQIV